MQWLIELQQGKERLWIINCYLYVSHLFYFHSVESHLKMLNQEGGERETTLKYFIYNPRSLTYFKPNSSAPIKIILINLRKASKLLFNNIQD